MRIDRLLVLVAVVLAAFLPAILTAAHDVDTNKQLSQVTRSELFRIIFDCNQATVDSAQVWYSSHVGSDTTVSEDVLFDDIVEGVRGRLRGLESNYKQKQAAAQETMF